MRHMLSAMSPAAEQVQRNVVVRGRRTSLRMERVLWETFEAIARQEKTTISALCSMIDDVRGTSSLTSSVRVFITLYQRMSAENAQAA